MLRLAQAANGPRGVSCHGLVQTEQAQLRHSGRLRATTRDAMFVNKEDTQNKLKQPPGWFVWVARTICLHLAPLGPFRRTAVATTRRSTRRARGSSSIQTSSLGAIMLL